MEDDDVPISSLIAEKKSLPVKKEEDDDDKPISALIAEKKNTPTKVATTSVKQESSTAPSSSNNGSASDSDDDLPVFEFVKKREREKQAHKLSLEKKAKLENGRKSTSSSSGKSNDNKSNNKTSTLEINSSGTSNWNSDSLECAFYSQTDKGKLIQSFLRRWWYSYEWPDVNKLGDIPKGYEPLDGFTGVYVSTRVSQNINFNYIYMCSFLTNIKFMLLLFVFLIYLFH